MARIFRHPFGLAPNGSIATVEQDSEAGDAQAIAVLALTVRGERPLAPGFGVTDPAFGGLIAGELAAGVATFGPDVTIREVITRVASDSEQLVEVRYE